MARKKGPQVDIAYDYIKNKILTFELEPGTEISDKKYEEYLQMSRSPIREAIMRLMGDGLIENVNGKYTVAPMSLRDIIEICQVRKAIETAAIKIIFYNGGPDDTFLKDLEETLHHMKENEDQVENNYQYDDQFHNLIVMAADNSRITEIGNKMRYQISRARWLNIFFPERVSEATEEHERIYNALKEKDLEKSVQAMEMHLDNSAKEFENALKHPAFNAHFLRGMAAIAASYEE